VEFKAKNYLNYGTFTEYFVITWLCLLFVLLFQLFQNVSVLQKIAGSLVGPLFVEGPV